MVIFHSNVYQRLTGILQDAPGSPLFKGETSVASMLPWIQGDPRGTVQGHPGSSRSTSAWNGIHLGPLVRAAGTKPKTPCSVLQKINTPKNSWWRFILVIYGYYWLFRKMILQEFLSWQVQEAPMIWNDLGHVGTISVTKNAAPKGWFQVLREATEHGGRKHLGWCFLSGFNRNLGEKTWENGKGSGLSWKHWRRLDILKYF